MARTTISIDGEVYKAALKRAKALGYRSFSLYCEHLVKDDVEKRPAHVTVREEPGQYRPEQKKRPA